jgi:folate-binding protein YgfZ
MDKIFSLSHREVISISGNDRFAFLQGLITKDIFSLKPDSLLYALLLSPKGRIDFDLFIFCDTHKIYMDTDQWEDLIKRLEMFKLRCDVVIEKEMLKVYSILSDDIQQEKECFIFKDPRHSEMGWRAYTTDVLEYAQDNSLYDEKRVRLGLPDGLKDMVKGRALPLEWNMDILNAIDFDKGCYMGQELTARTKYRELLKKRIKFLTNEDLHLYENDAVATLYPWGAFVYIKLAEILS